MTRQSEKQTHAHDLNAHFQNWCMPLKVDYFEKLADPMVLEQFKKYIFEVIMTYVITAALAGDYVLMHNHNLFSRLCLMFCWSRASEGAGENIVWHCGC